MARKISVVIVGNTSGIEHSFRRAAAAGGVFGHSLTGLATRVAGLVGGLYTLEKASSAAWSDFSKGQQVSAQTAAALKSTGGIANVTGGHIQALAKEIENLSGVQDHVVKSGENVLLAFTNIRNGVGKDQQLFDRTTRAMADLAARTGKDMPAAAAILGKALNDPAKGLARLRTVGIVFTADQKKQIEALQKTGHVQEAQALILKKFEDRYKGAAAAGSGVTSQLHKIRNAFQDIGGAVVANLLGGGATGGLQKLVKYLQDAGNQQRIVKRVADAIRQLAGAVQTVAEAARSLGGPLLEGVRGLSRSLGGWKTTIELAAGAWLGFKLAGVAAAVAVSAANLVAAGVVESAWKAALISTGWGAFAVAAGAAAVYVTTHWEQVGEFFSRFEKGLKILGLQIELDLLEPFSHVPGLMGAWARAAKNNVLAEIGGLQASLDAISASTGATAGAALGTNYYSAASGWIQATMTQLQGLQRGLLTPGQVVLQNALSPLQKAFGTISAGAKKGIAYKPPVVKLPLPFDTSSIGGGGGGGGAAAKSVTDLPDWLAYRKALAEGTKTLLDNLKVDKQIVAYFKQKLAGTKATQDRADLIGAINQYRSEQTDLQQQLADLRKTTELGKAYRMLGLGATGEALIPGRKSLLRRLGTLSEAVKGTTLDTKAQERILKNVGKVLRSHAGQYADMRDKIAGILDDLKNKLKDHAGDVTKFAHANTAHLLAGLGLSPDEVRAVRSRLAQLGPGGTIPHGSAAFAGAGGSTYTIREVHLHGVQNTRAFEEEMNRRMRSRPAIRRGAR